MKNLGVAIPHKMTADWLADEIARRWEAKFTPAQRRRLIMRLMQRIDLKTGAVWWGELKQDGRCRLPVKYGKGKP